MSYVLNQANPMRIAEQEYASATTIRFTPFTSCIGLVARKGTMLTAVHLVIMSNTDTLFDDGAAKQVASILGAYDEVVVLGLIDIWEDNVPAYRTLIKSLKSPTFVPKNDGTYGAIVANGKISITTA